MSDDDLKLSERIQQRVSRCKRCSGSGAYIEDGLELACPDCGDWLTCLRWVRELEAESAELRKEVDRMDDLKRQLAEAEERWDYHWAMWNQANSDRDRLRLAIAKAQEGGE